MDIRELQRNWEILGRVDPMWAILTEPDKLGGRWDEGEFFANGRALVAAIVEQLRPLGLPRQQGLALDFGCGLGRLTQAACGHFDRVIGVDIAESMIDGARQRNRFGERCEYVHNTHPNLSFVASASVDFVLSLLVLQHMRTELAQGYVKEFLRVLRPGGVALFQAPYAGRDCAFEMPGSAIMEMHVTPKERVGALVDAASARLVLCHDDDGGGAGWPSCVYVVTRD
ncbi:MAG TPA: class I SAM-dependent methyltransferase [Planctomycetota bacterium]|nr:class I SAM-dependent methyltransferase [Planctomycetota bacterium]